MILLVWIAVIWPSAVPAVEMTNTQFLFFIADHFTAPSDVAVSGDNRIYVLDGVNHRVKVFDENGAFLATIGREGSGPGEFRYPLGIDVDRSGNLYVADSGNHRVQMFNAAGSFMAQINIQSQGPHPADPTDVAVDESRRRCYVVDNDNHQILVYDLSTLKRVTTYGQPGTAKLEFRYPFLMTLDKANYLYIVDVINTRVQVLNPDGLYVATIWGWGVDKGQFFRPKGVAVDKDGKVYVSDSYLGVIQIFNANGDFLSVVGDRSTGALRKFKTPVGLTIDQRNRLYVVEMYADKVSVYRID
jgi:DNA-binding beta-propeller fold protein YncE